MRDRTQKYCKRRKKNCEKSFKCEIKKHFSLVSIFFFVLRSFDVLFLAIHFWFNIFYCAYVLLQSTNSTFLDFPFQRYYICVYNQMRSEEAKKISIWKMCKSRWVERVLEEKRGKQTNMKNNKYMEYFITRWLFAVFSIAFLFFLFFSVFCS